MVNSESDSDGSRDSDYGDNYGPLIQQIRSMFAEEVKSNGHLYDEVDIDRVSSDDYTVERYLKHQRGDLEKGFNMLVDAMRWRHSFGANTIELTDFPKEYFETGEAHTYTEDKNGISTVYLRVKLHKKIAELSPLSQKFLVYLFERCEIEGRKSGKGYGLIWDCYGGNLFNVDVELLQFLTGIWINYYPGGTKYVLLHELPWILRAIYRLARSWIPENLRDQICFASKSEIGTFVGQTRLPDYLNGQCKVNYKKAPMACRPMKDFMDSDTIETQGGKKFLDHYKSYLETPFKL